MSTTLNVLPSSTSESDRALPHTTFVGRGSPLRAEVLGRAKAVESGQVADVVGGLSSRHREMRRNVAPMRGRNTRG